MTTPDPIAGAGEAVEARLARAYAIEIPVHLLDRLDRRVLAAIEARQPWKAAAPRLALPRLALPDWPLLAVVPVLLAIVLVQTVATTSGGQSLYDHFGGYGWQQGEELNLTTTVDGYQVTLGRGYADANRLVLAITVEDLRLQGSWQLVNVSVADSSGVGWEAETGVFGAAGTGRAESMLWFHPRPGPAPAGRRAFTVNGEIAPRGGQRPMTSAFEPGTTEPSGYFVPVPFSFTFDLTVAGAFKADLQVASTLEGVTVTLDRIAVSSSMVVIDYHISGDLPPSDSGWGPIAFVMHNGEDVAVPVTEWSMDPRSDGAYVGSLETEVGVDDPSGDWTVIVPELTGDVARPGSSWDYQEIRLHGPWILRFSLP